MHNLHHSIQAKVKAIESRYPNDIVVVFDADGIYRYVSQNRQAIMGYTREETYGRHYQEVVAPDYMDQVGLTWVDTQLTGQSIDSTVQLRTKSGEPLRFRTVAWSVTDEDSNAEYMIVKSHLVQEG